MMTLRRKGAGLLSPRLTLSRWTKISARTAVLLLAALYGVTGGVIATYATWSDYRETVVTVEHSTADLARLLEDHFDHALLATDLLLRSISDDVQEGGMASLNERGAHWGGIMAAMTNSAHLESLFVTDAAGRLVTASAAAPHEGIAAADTDYAAAIMDGTESYIGQVTKDWHSGVYVFPVARRLTAPSGAFAGMVVAHVRVAFFKTLYHGLNLGTDPGLGIYRLDGAILVREPLPEADIGRNMAKNPIYTRYLPQAPIGTYHGKSAYDGVVRIVSYRKVEKSHLLVWVAMSLDDALQPWEQRLYRNITLAVFGMIITLGLSALALRAVNRERHVKTELIGANQSLYRANIELERFAEVAAHHLQEPLRTISSYAQLLQKRLGSQLQGETADFLAFLISGSGEMKRLLQDLQRYVALQQGPLPDTKVVLNDVVARAVTDLAPQISRSQAEIVVGELPTIHGDATQLRSLFRQLMENALTYRSPERPLCIAISAKQIGPVWSIAVCDNGLGIDPRFHERIFRIFERLHPRHEYPGTGIGLAICRKIVERHGGRIICTSDQPEGTTFTLSLAS